MKVVYKITYLNGKIYVGRGEGSLLADQVAQLLVWGLLADPSCIDEIRRLAAKPPEMPSAPR